MNRDELLTLWRRSLDERQARVAAGDEAAWRADRKFEQADEGFAASAYSPVPLAYVALNTRNRSVSFVNGVTRTIWLLAHGVSRFPIDLDGDADAYERALAAVQQLPPEVRFEVDRTPPATTPTPRHRARTAPSRQLMGALWALLLAGALAAAWLVH